MADFWEVIFFLFLVVCLTFADNSDTILQRFEEMDKHLANMNERIAELETENVKKTVAIKDLQNQIDIERFARKTEIDKLQKELETVNRQKTVETASLEKYLERQHMEKDAEIAELRDKLDKESNETNVKIAKLEKQLEVYEARMSNRANKQDKNDDFKDDSIGNKLGDGHEVEHDQKQRTNDPDTIGASENDTERIVPGVLTGNLLNRKGRLVLTEGMQVAFSATITPHSYGPLGMNQIVLFDKVISNVGNAYHAHSGIFTSPVDGVYVFHVSIASWTFSPDHIFLEIVKNGVRMSRFWAEPLQQTSQALIVSLSQGEEIYVRVNTANCFILGGKDRLVLSEGMQVAFSATITPHDYGPLGKGQIVQFDNVISNVGNAYHAHSGILTSPVDGVYVIYVTIASWKQTTGQSYLEVMQNGNRLCWIWAGNGDQSSQALIVRLKQGDEIYVKNFYADDVLLGVTFSSFSGFLLYQE